MTPMFPPTWSDIIPESDNLHWLAQCKRRIVFPIDSSEDSGLTAFEYAWKVFNSLYAHFRGKYDREKMGACVNFYLDKRKFFTAEKPKILDLCQIVDTNLQIDEAGETQKAIDVRDQLREHVHNTNIENSIDTLIKLLYIVRNGRIHGKITSTRALRAGSRMRPKPSVMTLPAIMLSLNIHLISGKSGRPVEYLESVVESRRLQLMTEIQQRVFYGLKP